VAVDRRFGETTDMQLLPRSRRGIWLLAVAVWCAACAGLWWALPVVPRAVLRLADNTRLLRLGVDDESAILERTTSIAKDGADVDSVTLELVELPTLRPIKTLLHNSPPVRVVDASADGRTLILERFGKDKSEYLSMVIPAGTTADIPLPDSGTASYGGTRISPDGRFLTLPIWDASISVEVWDVQRSRVHAILKGAHTPLAFSSDSRRLVVRLEDSTNSLRVINLETLGTEATFVGPSQSDVISVAFSDTGRYLFAQFDLNSDRSTRSVCWNFATSKTESAFYDPGSDQGTAIGAKMFIVHQMWDDSWTRCLEVTNPPSVSLSMPWDLQVSPRGQIAIVSKDVPEGFLTTLGRRLGLWYTAPNDFGFGGEFVDLSSGHSLGFAPVDPQGFNMSAHTIAAEWSGTGRTVAIYGLGVPSDCTIWDIPPRKSLTWFAAGAALLVLPIALVAWRRTRKLRAA
jgi:WD40 repeat protein